MRDFIAWLRGYIFTLKCRLLKSNITIGKGLKIYKRLRIKGKGKVSLGRNCLADGIKGDKSQYVTVYTNRSDAVVSIGDNACLCAARISANFSITIGADVLIEESGIADTDFHTIERSRVSPPDESKDKCQVIIGNRVTIGARSAITKGVQIGDDVAILPTSTVVSSIPSNSLALGNPAKIVRKLKDRSQSNKDEI